MQLCTKKLLKTHSKYAQKNIKHAFLKKKNPEKKVIKCIFSLLVIIKNVL